MRPDIYWVREVEPLRVALMPRPRSGEWLEDEVAGWRREGVGTVVSLLESHEVRDLGLEKEKEECLKHGISFVSFPIRDRSVPESEREAVRLIEELSSRLSSREAVAVHCRAGIGRSGLIVGCLLLKLGMPFESVFSTLSRARGTAVPDTFEQEEWVKRFVKHAEL